MFAKLGLFALGYILLVAITYLGILVVREGFRLTEKNIKAKMAVYSVSFLYIATVLSFLVKIRYAVGPAVLTAISTVILALFLRSDLDISLGETEVAILFLLPSFLGMLLWYYYPIVQTIIYSLFDLKFSSQWLERPFVGWKNFITVSQSKNFIRSAGFTFYFTVVSVFLQFWIGLFMAMTSFWVAKKWQGILRGIIVIPWAIPPIITAKMWRWLFNTDVGIGALLAQFGIISESPFFLGKPLWAMHSVIIADTWKWSSVMAIFLIGGLAVIPEDIYDAAKVDGARGFYRFRRLTLPLLTPTIIVAVLYRSMFALRTFDMVYGLTGGGPGITTETLSTFAYKYYFSYSDFGLGSAYAIAVFVIIIVLSVFYVSQIYENLGFRGD